MSAPIDVLVSGSARTRSTGGVTRVSLGGLRVSAPAGAVRRGQWLRISIGEQAAAGPEGAVSIAGGPYLVSTSQGEPSRPVSVSLSYDSGLVSGGSPVLVHGITRDHHWVYVPASVDTRAHTITATINSFSAVDVVQDASWFVGQMLGDRSDPADCKGDPPRPSWADAVSMPDGRGDPITSCLSSSPDGSQAIIKLVNNRGYAQVLSLSGAPLNVKHSWFSDQIDTTVFNAWYALGKNGPGTFMLGPGAQASLVIDKPPTQMAAIDITVDTASAPLSAVGSLLWALDNAVIDQLGTPLSAGNCIYSALYNVLQRGGSVGTALDQMHSCTSAAVGLAGAAKDTVKKLGYVLLAMNVYQQVLDLRLGDLYANRIGFTIPGTNPTFTDPSIHLAAANFGTITDGQDAVEHLSASGGQPPYSYHFYNLYPVPAWVTLSQDGTLTISPPSGDQGTYSFYVWVRDTTNAHSPFARDTVTFQTEPPQGVTVMNPGDQTSAVGARVSLQIHVSTSDGGAPRYSATGLPDGLQIDPASGLITGTPTATGSWSTTVIASDASGPSGRASFNWTVREPGAQSALAVSAGSFHTCALLSGGSVDCWGINSSGELGDGSTTSSDVPVAVSGLQDVVQVSAGWEYTCALERSGQVMCWGTDDLGQLGGAADAQTCQAACATTPILVPGVSNAVQISAGDVSVCALLSGGSVVCWGNHNPAPTAVPGVSDAVQISNSLADPYDEHACALRRGGSVVCWGDGTGGDLGDGSTDSSDAPVTVSGISDATRVTTGYSTSCALLSGGGVDCWGWGGTGELGDGSTASSAVPVAVSGLAGAVTLSAGGGGGMGGQACAVLGGGQVDCWGLNEYGELGAGVLGGPQLCADVFGSLDLGCSVSPLSVSGIAGAVDVSAGEIHTCAALQDGSVECWGSGEGGELGDGSMQNVDEPLPVQVVGLS